MPGFRGDLDCIFLIADGTTEQLIAVRRAARRDRLDKLIIVRGGRRNAVAVAASRAGKLLLARFRAGRRGNLTLVVMPESIDGFGIAVKTARACIGDDARLSAGCLFRHLACIGVIQGRNGIRIGIAANCAGIPALARFRAGGCLDHFALIVVRKLRNLPISRIPALSACVIRLPAHAAAGRRFALMMHQLMHAIDFADLARVDADNMLANHDGVFQRDLAVTVDVAHFDLILSQRHRSDDILLHENGVFQIGIAVPVYIPPVGDLCFCSLNGCRGTSQRHKEQTAEQ